jgi:integrase
MPNKLLTDLQVRRAKPKAGPYRIFDGEGLALWISPSGAKSWQLRYRHDGKGQTATLGKYPAVSLEDARKKAAGLRAIAADGHHLTVHKRLQKAKRAASIANTFEAVSEAWIESRCHAKSGKWSKAYGDEVRASLRNHLGAVHSLPLSSINAELVAPLLDRVRRSSPHMLEKVWRRLRGVMDFAVWRGVIAQNPLPQARDEDVRTARRHYPAVTALAAVGEILRAARASDPAKGIQRAHALLVFTAQRIGDVATAEWREFDLDAGVWTIPRVRMKRKDKALGDHEIPLPAALLASLREWRAADGEGARYVCPAPRDVRKHITPEAVEKHYRRSLGLGGLHSPHSWRSAFSTICREAGKDGDAIESQLDHHIGTKVQSAYDRAKRLELRRGLMQWYEITLIAARDGAAVHAITTRGGHR